MPDGRIIARDNDRLIVRHDATRPLAARRRDGARAHRFVESLIEELLRLVGECEDVLLGRETGPGFARRFRANVAVLERVADRDRQYVEVLEQLAAMEAEKRAR
jgi:hypothetical protein